ncbi:hypothetical protein [Streptomyces sp. KAU_LT]|uniref:hypothetical protein n=1 Tax=Streptomyces sp. KAU_LT TaxID=3046669 RepID=UPI0024B73A84|nr:hypothetical protein [Streptomyces sp. KAU_LT]MDI9834730.1 hypothetical protein [Streptomyces sp. KAU_LT]
MSENQPPAGGPQWGPRGSERPPGAGWPPPPGPPQKKRRSRGCLWGCAGALVVAVAIGVAVAVTAGDDGDDSTTSAPSTSSAPSATTPQGETRKAAGERDDLTSFQLDDRSSAGITDIWLTWTIKNNSSQKSDYSWEWEAVDGDGTRLANGTEFETAVQPGQIAKGETPTTLKTAQGVKLNITDFERNRAY